MAKHTARAARKPLTRLQKWAIGIGLFLALMFWHGSNLQAEQARAEVIPTPSVTSTGKLDEPVPATLSVDEQHAAAEAALCTAYEISVSDKAHAAGHDVRLGCEDAESLGLPLGSLATETAAPVTGTTTITPPAVTVTSTAAPATVTTTEYPADIVTTETAHPAHATVTTTAPQQTITEVIRPEPATVQQTADSEMPHCTQEDGSDPGQVFPCQWNGSVDGNGTGDSYILTESL